VVTVLHIATPLVQGESLPSWCSYRVAIFFCKIRAEVEEKNFVRNAICAS